MIATERLILRRWQPRDRTPFAAMNADARVMAHFPSALTAPESDALIDRVEAHFETNGFGVWAMERRSDGAFLGFTGLMVVTFPSPIEGDIEIGWRLAADAWGQGFAYEAAAAALNWGWNNTDCPRIVSMTVPANTRSWGLMARLGLARRADLDFEHPRMDPGHRLRPHIVYAADRR